MISSLARVAGIAASEKRRGTIRRSGRLHFGSNLAHRRRCGSVRRFPGAVFALDPTWSRAAMTASNTTSRDTSGRPGKV